MKERLELFKYKHIYDHAGSDDIFVRAIRESIIHHRRSSDIYSRYLDSLEYNPDGLKDITDIYDIPVLPAKLFKHHEILSIDRDKVAVHAVSSGTSGQRSQVFLDKESIDLGTKMIIKSMKYHNLISFMPTNYLLLGYEPREDNMMGNVKVLHGMMRFAPAIGKAYALRWSGSGYELDRFGIINALRRYEKQKLPVRILGFPSYLFMMLESLRDMGIKPLKLSKKSIVLTGGGWKNYDNRRIDKKELYTLVENLLGIPKENCRDFYSAVEHSVAYPECKNHRMHVPIWSRVVMRDPKTLEPLGFDEEGLLSFISPLVSSMPISSIVMSDRAILRDGRQCGCGIQTPYFEVISRAGRSGGKTCAMTAAEFINGGR